MQTYSLEFRNSIFWDNIIESLFLYYLYTSLITLAFLQIHPEFTKISKLSLAETNYYYFLNYLRKESNSKYMGENKNIVHHQMARSTSGPKFVESQYSYKIPNMPARFDLIWFRRNKFIWKFCAFTPVIFLHQPRLQSFSRLYILVIVLFLTNGILWLLCSYI